MSQEKDIYREYSEGMTMAAATIERQTAQITTIGAIIGESNTKVETQLQPKYIYTGKEMNRVHIIAVVVSISAGTMAEAILDDGTGRITGRSFESPSFFEKVQLGDIVRVIGKVRAFNEQVYIIPEIMKQVQDRQFVTLHKLLLRLVEKNINLQTTQPVAEIREEQIHEEQVQQNKEGEEIPVDADDTIPDSPFDELLLIIKKLDNGDGAQVEEILAQSGENSEKMIQSLLEAGEVFEIRPGRIKVLE